MKDEPNIETLSKQTERFCQHKFDEVKTELVGSLTGYAISAFENFKVCSKCGVRQDGKD